MSRTFRRAGRSTLSACAACLLAGCASIAGNAAGGFADNLGAAIRNQTDPETVRAGAPAFLLLMDSLLEGNADSAELLGTAARFYAFYGIVFVAEPERVKVVTERARDYGNRALCARDEATCGWRSMSHDEFVAVLARLDRKDVPVIYSFALSELAYLRAHPDDYSALAELPNVEAALERLIALDETWEGGSAHVFLGILNTLRPPSLGGRPEVAREHFERAIELSNGRDLGAKVEYARSYARLLYDRELHDRLLQDVLAADPNVPGLVLSNTLAQTEARRLLASSDAYF
ncbi:MAG TPA: TRAP transporter TatT component family protein [Gammaproteobacteria bacterium]|nr:TRAP transporter TatT component family protein [Gammaproteobacteria bacterium]